MRLDVIYNEECLRWMRRLPDASVDMILCDLPYGTTHNKWDSEIPLEPLWEQYKRIAKPQAAIVLTCQQPFASKLVVSNRRWFRYEWIWEKNVAVGFLNANRAPLRAHENVLVFARCEAPYRPQKVQGKPWSHILAPAGASNYGAVVRTPSVNTSGERCPRSVLHINRETGLHPTQKPVALFEYFIRTYSNPGAVVLDNCIGSGTTAVACINTGRHYIGCEKDARYCNIARTRVKELRNKLRRSSTEELAVAA